MNAGTVRNDKEFDVHGVRRCFEAISFCHLTYARAGLLSDY